MAPYTKSICSVSVSFSWALSKLIAPDTFRDKMMSLGSPGQTLRKDLDETLDQTAILSHTSLSILQGVLNEHGKS